MQNFRSPLTRHLGAVLALKAVLLILLWLAFVRDARVPVDAAAMDQRISVAAPAAAPSEGEHRE
jgi:hypothetical protein